MSKVPSAPRGTLDIGAYVNAVTTTDRDHPPETQARGFLCGGEEDL